MKFDVMNRYTGDVQFTAEVDCNEDDSHSIKLGLAVAWGSSNAADLHSANLRSADLRSADLHSANLRSADLSSADLRFADLSSADLSSADLRFADLRFADLRFADLSSADLSFADLSFANLSFADLHSAKGGMTVPPIQISGDKYHIAIIDEHILIGCEKHLLTDWENFDDARILQMDGKAALEWWRDWKGPIMSIAKAAGRPLLVEAKEEAA